MRSGIITPNEKEIERARIGEEIRGRILNTRQGPLPLIEDENYRALADRVNQEAGRYLEDKVTLRVLSPSYPHQPPKSWWNLVQSLSALDRNRITRSLNLYKIYGNVTTIGELRTIEPSAMLGLRGATTSNRGILLGLTMFEKEPNKLNT